MTYQITRLTEPNASNPPPILSPTAELPTVEYETEPYTESRYMGTYYVDDIDERLMVEG